MSTKKFPIEYRIPTSQDNIRSFKDPNLKRISTIHAFVKIRDMASGHIPDKINPRSHEQIKTKSRVPQAVEETLENTPELFHLLNRGCLIIAKKAWYDNHSKTLHFIVESEEENGMVDGATTDRVLAGIKQDLSSADFSTLTEEEIPAHFKDAYIHLEIIAGDIDQELRIQLAEARNTSVQVKEFSIEDLKHSFDWLKELLNNSQFKGKIRYRENDPEPVDIRTILALLTMFLPEWNRNGKDPIKAYTSKASVFKMFQKEYGKYEQLAPVVLDILKLYDHLHLKFNDAYKVAYGDSEGKHAKLGARNEVYFIDPKNKRKKPKTLPLTGKTTRYVLPDGWLYPLLGSFRMLLQWPNGRGSVKWETDPFEFFSKNGKDLVSLLVDHSYELGRNANATGKSKGIWDGLRNKVDNLLLRTRLQELEKK